MKIYGDPRYWSTKVGHETTHKAMKIAERVEQQGGALTAPPLATKEQLLLAHTSQYVASVLTGTPKGSDVRNGIGGWDAQFPVSRRASTGGVIAATLGALQTGQNEVTLSSGIHHARRNTGAGFCTFNGLVIAAKLATAASTGRVVILDLDAHGGGGTAAGIAGLPRIEQMDVTVCPYDTYKDIPNATLILANGTNYLQAVRHALDNIDPEGVAVLIYNAGMDPHEKAGGVTGITTDVIERRENMVYGWAYQHNIPVAATMAGGYTVGCDEDELVDLHMITINTAGTYHAIQRAA